MEHLGTDEERDRAARLREAISNYVEDMEDSMLPALHRVAQEMWMTRMPSREAVCG